jgi:hypothetical protein
MDLRTVMFAAVLASGSGCAEMKWWKNTSGKAPEGVPTAQLSPQVRSEASPIVQGSGPSSASAQLAKLTGKSSKVAAANITVMWRNRPDYLPDPSHNGEMCAGLVGQLFLYDANMQFAPADGTLMITLFDESPRPPGQKPRDPEVWAFNKDTLRKLVTMDERFGKSYALFLPWPSYSADITKIRMAVRYDPEEGHSLYIPDTKITIDTSVPGAEAEWTNKVMVPGAQSTQPPGGFSALGGPPPSGVSGPGSGPGLGMIPSGPAGSQPMVPASPTGPVPGGAIGGAPYGSLPMPPPNFGSLPPVAPNAVPGGPLPPNAVPQGVTVVPLGPPNAGVPGGPMVPLGPANAGVQGGPMVPLGVPNAGQQGMPMAPIAPVAPGGPGGAGAMAIPPDLPPIAIIAPRR